MTSDDVSNFTEITSSIKRIKQFNERLLKTKEVNDSVIFQYNELEKQFRKIFPQISFEKFPQITGPSTAEKIMINKHILYDRYLDVILYRLEFMIGFFPDNVDVKALTFNITSIENFQQIINTLNIDNSTKTIINNYITQLEKEIKKPILDKQRIIEIITKIFLYDLPKEILVWLIKILLKINT
jgi:hypothetical protein